MTQVTWHRLGRDQNGSQLIAVDGREYFVGRGNPGTSVDQEYNNCLIDSLRQCLNLMVNRKTVRQELMASFGNAVGRARVTETSYLDVEEHGQHIITYLFRHNLLRPIQNIDLDQFCIIALSATDCNHGVVVGRRDARRRLVVLNHGDIHFDPCLPRSTESMSGDNSATRS